LTLFIAILKSFFLLDPFSPGGEKVRMRGDKKLLLRRGIKGVVNPDRLIGKGRKGKGEQGK
jgi:hypothetical protein